MPMTDEQLQEHLRLADAELRALTEDQRRAILERVRGSLAADGAILTPEDEALVLAKMRGDVAEPEFLASLLPARGR